MSNYTPATDFSVKDGLTTGDPEKAILGSDIDDEFDAINTAIATKEDSANKGASSGYCGLDSSSLVPVAYLPTATTTAIGALETATTAEATTGTATNKIMTPANVASVFAAPPALGSGTPAAVTGTTVTGTTVAATSTMTLGGVGVVTTARTLTAGEGITGGGTLASDRSFALSVSGLTAFSGAVDATSDYYVVYDASAAAHRKISANTSSLESRNVASSGNFASGDVGTIVYWTGTSGTLTMPTGVGQDDCYIIVINSGSGTLTIAGSSVTITSANSLVDIPAGGMATLVRESSGVWFLGGSLQ